MDRRLIVNADDYGLTPSVSAGIRRAHLKGVVTSTTAMLNQPEVAAELDRAQADCPNLGLGVHLVITKGRPLLPPAAIRSITGLGNGHDFPALPQLIGGLDRLNPDEVQAEWQAQIDDFVRLTGRPPTHLDSHHHAAYLSGPLLRVLLSLSSTAACPIRWPITSSDPAQAHLGLSTAHYHLKSAAAMITAPRPDHFEARFYGDAVSADLLRTIIAGLPTGITELMCHPALPDDTLAQTSSYHRHRAQELTALTDPAVRAAVAAAGVTLATFAALAA